MLAAPRHVCYGQDRVESAQGSFAQTKENFQTGYYRTRSELTWMCSGFLLIHQNIGEVVQLGGFLPDPKHIKTVVGKYMTE
jgi:hypothetical protein